MWQSYILWSFYLITMKIGIIGNLWVICSVIRNTRSQRYGWLRRPSDCLRSYIFVLALVDFFVVCSLALRLVYIWDETLTFESANCSSKHHRLSEPRYVRAMTSSIIRVAVFHMICWFPFCFIAMIPTEACSLVLVSIRAINRVNDKHAWVLWIPILANWLTYLNSALNWIFYAVLNRDLRELIRNNTRRRKRSTMTYYHSSSNFTNKNSRQRSLSIHVLAESPQL
ncbi:unnamed protein product [Acanthocheilonema viteae]|uniref:G-protein coupled receptors family 1 profile domain-containing protein n=1 Tax=Acanthocheilonema viteae TaxID=6277 RepID=A0A498SKW5_ACAVI|nr:unnamed protein product [Acanthocheilonema viteae]